VKRVSILELTYFSYNYILIYEAEDLVVWGMLGGNEKF